MASTYSPNLRLELIGTGEQQGTWGTTTNTNLGTLLEEAIGGYASVTVSNLGDTTLTTNNGSADESRNMVINLTGTITAARNVICPAIEKLYVVKNATTGGYAVTFKVSGQTGVTIPNGETYFVYVNGIDVQKIVGNTASTNTTNTFTENQIIQVTDNTDAALRITQLGTGNAILVEDSTNPDSTPFVVDATGYVLSGAATSVPLSSGSPGRFQATSLVGFQSIFDGANANPAIFEFAKNRAGAIVNSGDVAGQIRFSAFDGTNYLRLADIYASVGGTPGTNDMPGDLVFSTTADGASSPTERMRINSLGNINIGTADDPGSVLQITGATTPTGVMVGSISGTTLTITSVSSGSVAVGDRLFIAAAGLDYNTYITALGTGSGGVGNYTVNTTTTLASTTIYFYPSRYNTISFVDTDTTSTTNQPYGGIEWYSSDASSPGAGVKAYVASFSESAGPDSAMVFGTADTAQAVERVRITSAGYVGVNTSSPSNLLHVNGAAQATTFEVGNASDTTISRSSAGVIAVEGGIVPKENRTNTFTAQQNIELSGGAPIGLYVLASSDPTSDRASILLGNWQVGQDVNGNGTDDFFIYDSAAGTRMYISTAGNVGIGTTSPSAKLDVVGAVEATTFELGNTTDTTISRSSAGVIAVEGDPVAMLGTVNAFTARQQITGAGVALTVQGNNTGVTGFSVAQNRVEIIDTDTTVAADQILGVIRFGTSDATASDAFPAELGVRAVDANGGAYWTFRTATSGGTSTNRLNILSDGQLQSGRTYDAVVTGGRAVQVSSTGLIGTTSSSIKYKKDVEDLSSSLSDNVLQNLRPVWYRSKNPTGDEKDTWSQIGLIAEEVAAIEPRLVVFRLYDVTYDENGEQVNTLRDIPEPEDVNYARLSVFLLDIAQRQAKTIKSMEERLAALEAKVQ